MNTYYKVPISYYYLYLKKTSKEGKEFARKKLNLYKNWKRRAVLIALELGILPTKRMDSKADIIFLGNRKKEFYFDTKKIITFGDCEKDYKTRVRMNKYFNCIKNPKYTKDKLEEDLIWPTKKITDKDVIKVFEGLLKYYKKGLRKITSNQLQKSLKDRFKILNKSTIKKRGIISSNMHGDFWKGNIEIKNNLEKSIFDWDENGRGHLLEDFINYFFTEYRFTKRINNKLFVEILDLFKQEFSLSKDDILFYIWLETQIKEMQQPKSQWKNIRRFEKEINNLL